MQCDQHKRVQVTFTTINTIKKYMYNNNTRTESKTQTTSIATYRSTKLHQDLYKFTLPSLCLNSTPFSYFSSFIISLFSFLLHTFFFSNDINLQILYMYSLSHNMFSVSQQCADLVWVPDTNYPFELPTPEGACRILSGNSLPGQQGRV